jgi:hypothetical protein
VNGIPAERDKGAAVTENHALDRFVIAQHRDQGIAVASVSDPRGDPRALRRQGLRLAMGAIVNDDAMAGLQQVQRHWRTHVAEPDEAHIHGLILLSAAGYLLPNGTARDTAAP